jgi:glycosyltransferase involved in cell wall biosynthesis
VNDKQTFDMPAAKCTSPRVLVVAPSPTARGGIASVIARHQSTAAWAQFGCRVLTTVRGNTALGKGLAALWAYALAPFVLTRADIVHFHVAAGISAVRKCPILWMAALLRRKIILHFHCAGAASLFESTPAAIQHFLRSHVDLVVVLSPYWKMEFERRWPGVRTAVLPNPVAWVETTAGDREPDILFVGALTKRKGYHLLLEAMAEVVRQFPSTRLWMAGEGEIGNAKDLARSLGIERSVRFLGWVTGERLEDLYAQPKILCLPSFAEGVPMAVLEAMMHGVAVITTPVGGIPDVLVDGENGILVPTGDPAAIAAALLRLLRDPHERRRLGRAGQSTVRESNSVARVSKLLAEIYSGLHNDNGAFPTRSADSVATGCRG